MTAFQVGDAVRASRDEDRFPVRGTWKRHRNRAGFVVCVNASADVDPPEYGVIMTVDRPRWRQDDGHVGEVYYNSEAVLWFRGDELVHREG